MGQKSIVLVVCALICGIQACKHQILKILTFCTIHCVISWEIHLTHEEVPSMTLEIYKGASSQEQEKNLNPELNDVHVQKAMHASKKELNEDHVHLIGGFLF